MIHIKNGELRKDIKHIVKFNGIALLVALAICKFAGIGEEGLIHVLSVNLKACLLNTITADIVLKSLAVGILAILLLFVLLNCIMIIILGLSILTNTYDGFDKYSKFYVLISLYDKDNDITNNRIKVGLIFLGLGFTSLGIFLNFI